jgi:hypothetical protein
MSCYSDVAVPEQCQNSVVEWALVFDWRCTLASRDSPRVGRRR